MYVYMYAHAYIYNTYSLRTWYTHYALFVRHLYALSLFIISMHNLYPLSLCIISMCDIHTWSPYIVPIYYRCNYTDYLHRLSLYFLSAYMVSLNIVPYTLFRYTHIHVTNSM